MPLFDKNVHIRETRTLSGANRLMRGHNDYTMPDAQAPYGYLRGRPIIGRDSQIQGGVSIGGNEHEAIIVDDTLENSLILQVYQSLKDQLFQAGDFSTMHVLNKVMRHTKHHIRYGYAKDSVGADEEISLDYYINQGKGHCRHQNLLVAYIMEKLISEGVIPGKFSLDRNEEAIILQDGELIYPSSPHVWCRFTDQNGTTYILDVSLNKECLILEPENNYKREYNRFRPDSSIPKKTIGKAGCSDKITIEHFIQIFCDKISELPILNIVNNNNKLFAEYIDLELNKRFVSLDSFKDSRLSVGRDPSNQITNVNPALSRFHCQIHHNGKKVQLFDQNSKNGTHYRISPLDERANSTRGKIIKAVFG